MSTLRPALAVAELFGARKGAYTGAVRDQPGYFGQAEASPCRRCGRAATTWGDSWWISCAASTSTAWDRHRGDLSAMVDELEISANASRTSGCEDRDECSTQRF